MELILRAKHFKDAVFEEPSCCPVAKAALELFPEATEVEELLNELAVGQKIYKHESYMYVDYLSDCSIAKKAKSPDEIIREIELIEKP